LLPEGKEGIMRFGPAGLSICIFLLALLTRLLIIGFWQGAGRGEHLSSDATVYYEIAQNLVQGRGFLLEGTPSLRRGPLYPLFLALSLKLGSFPLLPQLGQAFFGAVSCFVLFWLGRSLFGNRAAGLAAGIQSVDYLSVRQTVSMMPEVLFVFFLLMSTWFLFLAKRENARTVWWGALAGVFAGLSVLAKEVLAFYLLLLGIWLFLGRDPCKNRAVRTIVFLASFLLTLSPWVVRNYLVLRKPVFITVSTGHSFYLGNNPSVNVRVVGEEWDFYFDSWFPHDDPNLPPLFTPEADHYLLRRGFEYAASHPTRFIELTGKKFLRLWFPYYQDSPWLAKGLTVLCYVPVLVLGSAGLLLSVKHWKELIPLWGPIVYLSSVHAVTISSIRYRFPLMPFLTIFAAFAVFELWNRRAAVLKLSGPTR